MAFGFLMGLLCGSVLWVEAAPDRQCNAYLARTVRGILDGLEGKGWIGISVRTHGSFAGKIQVSFIDVGSPAEKSDLQVTDVLVAIDGERFDPASAQATIDTYRRLREAYKPGRTVSLTRLLDDGSEETLTMVAGPYPFWAKSRRIGVELLKRTNLGNYKPGRS